MKSSKIKELIIKYIKEDCSKKEVKQIIAYFKHSKDFFEVPTIEDTYQFLEGVSGMDESEASRMHDKILEIAAQKEKTPVKKSPFYWRYVTMASVALIIALTIFLDKNDTEPQFTNPIVVNNQIQKGTDKALLTLENGSEVALKKGTKYQTEQIKSNGEEIVYQKTRNQKPEARNQIAYNTLTTPRGGQFQITLADGTKVWLNSESQIKYPVAFTDGKPRQVELIYGEAYFDVSSSTVNNGAEFKVIHSKQEIEVLGTEFNVKAYKDDYKIITTLVEGKISIKNKSKEILLKPNQKLLLNLKDNTLMVELVDTYNEVSWKSGFFSFKDMSLLEIMNVLSRWYDVNFIFKKEQDKNILFGGIFKKNQNLNDIIDIIESTNTVKFEINNKNIIVK
ncbi:FecR family protein [uncultured Polaribacter sp.]|uniref:FecR family protein n=1 Tax=uncultured Polaribacter sp. TaxID=174711 RepID=UPI00261168BA|nr:FecR family protein [uncultured Polaribacter sp.]